MINANFTETIGGISVAGKTLPVYEVRVEKGCGTKSEFMKNVKKGNLCKITIQYSFWIYCSLHDNAFLEYFTEAFFYFRRKQILNVKK